MSADVAGSDVAQTNGEVVIEQVESTVEAADSSNVDVAQGFSQPQNSAFNGTDEPLVGAANHVSDPNFPKDAADEWPATYEIRSFYFVRCRPYDDPNLKAKFDQADKEVQKKRQQRSRIIDDLRAKKSDRAQVVEQLKALNEEKKQYNMVMDEKRIEMKPLQEALGTLRGPNNSSREKGVGLCSSEEELNDLIRSLNYRIQHESIPLNEEKQLMRDIKQLEGTRSAVIANAAVRAKIQDSLGQKESIQEQVKMIGTDLDGARKERLAVNDKIKYLQQQLGALKDEISALEEELKLNDEKKGEISETFDRLRAQRDVVNKPFNDYRRILAEARFLAAKKDTKALEELCNTSVDEFMSRWSSSKAVRDDYEKRILLSLDNRQLSRDGRMRNPSEKPLVLVETSAPASTEKTNPKPSAEDPKPATQEEHLSAEKAKDSKKKVEPKAVPQRVVEEEEFFVVEKPPAPKEKEIDPAKLKELKREEEMEKQRQALERKKKLAEKAAAKAAIRAQKEAEKKQKDREKKLKKKDAENGFPTNPEDSTATEDVVAEAEEQKAEEAVETPAPAKPKEQKQNTVKARNKTRGRDVVLPKAVLKRKKSTNYWVWAAAATAALVIVFILSYNFM